MRLRSVFVLVVARVDAPLGLIMLTVLASLRLEAGIAAPERTLPRAAGGRA